MMSALQSSCYMCHGAREISWNGNAPEPCTTCRDVEPALVRKCLMELTVEQMAFLRAYEHTLAFQPITQAEFEAHRCEYWVEDDDAVIEGYDIVVPATQHWIAGGWARNSGPGGSFVNWIHYTPLGLALRVCLMAGADARCR